MTSRRLFLLSFIFCFCFVSLSAAQKPKYQYELAACLMFQNEGRFLKEWIEYHRLVGVQHFYLFNNASTDGYMEVLEPYIESGIVDLYHYPEVTFDQQNHSRVQCAIYNHALSLAKGKAKWLAIIDADEFIFPVQKNSLSEVLKNYESFGGVYLNWLAFGTSRIEKIPENKLMIEMLVMCQKECNALGKSIVRPERVSICVDPHRMHYAPPYYHVNTNNQKFDWVCPIANDKLVIHHYYTGDLYNVIHVKYPRRKKWIGMELESYIKDLDGLNVIENKTMDRFVSQLRALMSL